MFLILAALLLAGCTDALAPELAGGEGAAEGDGDLLFRITTEEQADRLITLGTTRADGRVTPDSATLRANQATVRTLEGDAPAQLSIQRVPMPVIVGPKPSTTEGTETLATRASADDVVTSTGTYFHDSLTIWGYTQTAYPKVNGETGTTIFNEVLLKRIRNWRSSAHWPYGGGKMRFYAIAPALESLEDLGVTNSTACDYVTKPIIHFVIPEAPGAQRDLLYGESEVVDIEAFGTKESHLGEDDKYVDLRFHHLLTAVRFAQSDVKLPDNVTLKRITISGVKNTGTYDAGSATPAWTALSGSATYTLENLSTAESGSPIFIDGQQVLFVMPQTLPEGATLTVELEETKQYKTTDKGELELDSDNNPQLGETLATPVTHTLTCSLKGDEWPQGYTVIYTLTIGKMKEDYYLFVDQPAAHEHSTSPITGAFTIYSFRNYIDYSSGTPTVNHNNAVAWKVAGYTEVDPYDAITHELKDDAFTTTVPAWFTTGSTLTSTTTSHDGGYGVSTSYGIAGQNHAYFINGERYAYESKHSDIIGQNSSTKSASNWDLSATYPDGSTRSPSETANCYIVNRTGTYQFPMVYGNGNTGGGDPFKDHRGETITKASIKEQLDAKSVSDIDGSHKIAGTTIGPDSETPGETKGHVTYWKWDATTGTGGLDAVVTWQDVENDAGARFITSLEVNTKDGNIISFNMAKAAVGNAVITLLGRQVTAHYHRTATLTDGVYTYGEWIYDNETYGAWENLWSWHIWMTDEVYSNNAEYDGKSSDRYYLNYNGDKANHLVSLNGNTILPVNLGWVPDDDNFGFYAHRKAWVKLRQVEPAEGAKETVVVIEQHARQPLITGTSTVYQWGRPLALPAVLHVDNTTRPIYDGSDNDISNQFVLKNTSTFADAITQTKAMLRTSEASRWFDLVDKKAPQFWSSDTKTIYDPCPPGFRLPPTSIFTVLSRTKGDTNNGTGLNIWPDVGEQKSADRNHGGYFYTTPYDAATFDDNRYGPMVYMPVTAEWQGDLDEGTKMNDTSDKKLHINSTFGIFWCGDETTGHDKDAPALWYCPEWSYTNDGAKPAFRTGFFTNNRMYYSSAQPIRPVAK